MHFMQLLSLLLFFCFLSISSAKLSCLQIITKLSYFDKCLSSRLDFKVQLASKSKNFLSLMKDNNPFNYTCNGTYYTSQHTSSWVNEVFEGFQAQYSEIKFYNDFKGEDSGYTTDFDSKLDNIGSLKFHTIMHFRHTGIHDHMWTVEQLPEKDGYKIYQSYQDAYSLQAWLSKNLTELFEKDNGDIMLPLKTKAIIDAKLKKMSNESVSLNNLEALPANLQNFLPFFQYIRDINQTTVEQHFKKAWEKYGQGKTISYSKFWNGYIPNLIKIVNYFKKNSTSIEPFPEEIYNLWIELFGATNNVVFPGLPTNMLTKFLDESKKYRFEYLERVLFSGADSDSDNCRINANLIMSEDKWNTN